MEIKKTFILPSDDLKLSLAIFENYLQNLDSPLLVVIGDDELARAVVLTADLAAHRSREARWVVWTRNLEHTEKLSSRVKDTEKLVTDWDEVLAFSVNRRRTVCRMFDIYQQPSELELSDAFANAEVVKKTMMPEKEKDKNILKKLARSQADEIQESETE